MMMRNHLLLFIILNLGVHLNQTICLKLKHDFNFPYLLLSKEKSNAHQSFSEYNIFNFDEISDSSEEDNSTTRINLMSLTYSGFWNSTFKEQTQQFSFFNKTQGFAEFWVVENPKEAKKLITFEIYDGEYIDQKHATIQFRYDESTDYQSNISTFKNQSINLNYTLYFGSSVLSSKTCRGSYQLSFVDSITQEPYNTENHDYKDVEAYFWLNNTNCSVAISSKVILLSVSIEEKAIYYSAMMTLICVAEIYACIRMNKAIIQNEILGFRTSIVSLVIMTAWDFFICLYHSSHAFNNNDFFQYYITPAFAYFLLFIIFETRLIGNVLRVTYQNRYPNGQDFYKQMKKIRHTIIGFFIFFLIFCAVCFPLSWFLYLTGLFFVPQIVHNALKSQRYKFDYAYVFLFGAFRTIPSFYIRGCPENIFRFSPDPNFVYCYSGIIILQIFVLILQSKFGSRFFIPTCFLPPKYNYYIKVNTDQSSDESENCPICMDPLNRYSTTSESALVQIKLPKYIINMLTPCRHQFHEECLKEWMDLKLECPFCRTQLPSI